MNEEDRKLQIAMGAHMKQLIGQSFASFLWSPYGIGQTIIFLPCGFFLLFSSSFSSPNLSRRRLDVCRTSTHGVALVRILNAGLKCTARCSLEMQDAKKSQKSPSGHHRTTLSGYIFVTKAHIDNRKKLIKQQYLLHASVQYGELRPTSG